MTDRSKNQNRLGDNVFLATIAQYNMACTVKGGKHILMSSLASFALRFWSISKCESLVVKEEPGWDNDDA